MKFLIQIFLLLWLAAGCSSKAEKPETNSLATSSGNAISKKYEYNGLQIEVTQIKECGFPSKDPLVEEKKNKKLLLLQIRVSNTGSSNKQDIVPMGASIEDEKGNIYETSPGVVAMAQSSGCIKGDDLKSYNRIWSGEITKGETLSAFVVGFEIPKGAVAEKFYWNTNWTNKRQYVLLTQTSQTVNY